MSDTKITIGELTALFGDTIPIEAVILIWNAPPEATTAEVRHELRALARKSWNGYPPDRSDGHHWIRNAPLDQPEVVRWDERADRWFWRGVPVAPSAMASSEYLKPCVYEP